MLLLLSRQINVHLCHRTFPVASAFSGRWMQSRICFQKPEKFEHNCKGNFTFQRGLRTSPASCSETSLNEKIKEKLSVFKTIDFKQLKSAPFPAIVYGFGGIIPFVFPPLYFILGSYSSFLATSQLLYGATILAFVGGVKWGNALAKDEVSHDQIGMSTVPSLVAWSSLLVPEPLGFLIVSSGLAGALYIDLVSSKYPPWFCALRSTLTGIAVGSLITTLLCHVLH